MAALGPRSERKSDKENEREREREKKEREDERGEEKGATSLSEATQDGGGVVDHSGEMEEWEGGEGGEDEELLRSFVPSF